MDTLGLYVARILILLMGYHFIFPMALYGQGYDKKAKNLDFPNENLEQSFPNIIIITVDNVGYGDYKLYNKRSPIITPNLDRIAAEGAVLTNFYTAGATCTTSRATLLTGRIPQRNKLDYQMNGLADNYGIGLRQSEILLPQVIKNSPGNYATAAFGKWNIGFAPGSRPTDRGFDEYLGIVSGNADHFTHVYAGNPDLYHNTEAVSRSGEYSTDMFANAAIDFIKTNAKMSRPWFIYLPFDAPHSPGQRNIPPDELPIFKAPDAAFEPYGISPDEKDPIMRYHVVVTAIDRAIGRLLSTLDSLDISKDTFIFFYSDNGANVKAVQERIMGVQFSTNTPLRGGSSTLYEGGIRIPAVVKWGNKIKPGSLINTRLWSPDFFTACVKLSGAELPADRVIDGKNPLPVLLGETAFSPHATLYFEIGEFDALHWGDWKIVRENTNDAWQLFNIKEDVSEANDLALSRPDLVQKLRETFSQKQREVQHASAIEENKRVVQTNNYIY
ncbi:sulfatase-like hydrolase/transferase [Parapedobacter indicus]|uniref:Arylsulfatase A n=1 Tax=Parapedobacter indicus TaxID=1477437 RepID=A0A1I3FS52_9SPHI|nr:sulfatase-like hydrolase/transferase [Parapedobacter indicus]PPL03859.1 arylsulfatase A-like enzyme [Parapedobacter indicus]SFI13922.1 Arylsulfatase A [Parapedobacter indicus]